MARRDEDALTWDGDDDPTLVSSAPEAPDALDDAAGPPPASLPDGWRAVGRGSDGVGTDEAADTAAASRDSSVSMEADAPAAPAEPVPMGNAALLATGVLAGVYLLYAIGWLIGGLRLQGVARFLVSDVVFVPALWLAVAAPVLWFATVFVATRRSRAWVRYVWLAVGVLLLVPWPFIMMGAVGS